MRTSLILSFLVLGLTGTWAAPANSNSGIELEARHAPCAILCRPGTHAVYNSRTRKCQCVPNTTKEICLTATTCIAGSSPVWDPKALTCSCVPVEDSGETQCLIATTCLEGNHPFYNPITKECSCKPNDGEFICIAATTCASGFTPVFNATTEECVCQKISKRQEEFPDPSTCPTVRCAEGYTPKYIPGETHCICELNAPVEEFPDPSTCPTIRCAEGFTPKYIPDQRNCICEENAPDPKTCPTIRCAAGYKPLYVPGKKHCICQKIPGWTAPVPRDESSGLTERKPDPNCRKLKCKPGYIPWYDATTKTCNCVLDQSSCPTIRCANGFSSVYYPKTNTCGCEPRTCPDTFCISEKQPVYNIATSQCECQWIPGLEPTDPCDGIFCIAEMIPTPDFETNTCSCVYIPGLEPGTPTDASANTKREALPSMVTPVTRTILPAPPHDCRRLICNSEQYQYWNTTTGRCECRWIPRPSPVIDPRQPQQPSKTPRPKPSPKPSPVVDPCADLLCISEMTPTLNTATGKCECKWIPGLEPTGGVKAKRDVVETPVPTPTVVTDPLNCRLLRIFCEGAEGGYSVYDPVTKSCRCPTPTPVVEDKCERLRVYCEFGDHKMHFDKKCKCCKCPAKGT